MPPALLIIIKDLLPMVLADAVKAGALTEAQKISVEAVVGAEEFLGKMQTFYGLKDFPDRRNDNGNETQA